MFASNRVEFGSRSPEPLPPGYSIGRRKRSRSSSETTQLAQDALKKGQGSPPKLHASRVRCESPPCALKNAIAAMPGNATLFTLPSPHYVDNKSREELQDTCARIPPQVHTIKLGRAFSSHSESLPLILSALPLHIEELDLRECSLWIHADTALLLSILGAIPPHIKKMVMGSAGFAHRPLPDLEAICAAIPTHLLLFDVSTPLPGLPPFFKCARANQPLFDMSNTLLSRIPAFVLARIFARLSPRFPVLNLSQTHIGSRRMGELVHIFGSISRGVVHVDPTFFHGKSAAELQLLSHSLAIEGAAFTWSGFQMPPQTDSSAPADRVSYEQCLQKCRSYSSPLRAKADAVTTLQGLLERCRARQITPEQVLIHLLCALRISNNPLFDASRFRTSTVKTLFGECVLLMRSLRKGLPDPFILEGDEKSYFISRFYEIYDPERDACGYAIKGGLCKTEEELRVRSHPRPTAPSFANQDALFSHFLIPPATQRQAGEALQEFVHSLESAT